MMVLAAIAQLVILLAKLARLQIMKMLVKHAILLLEVLQLIIKDI
jgi:hypothetical protein